MAEKHAEQQFIAASIPNFQDVVGDVVSQSHDQEGPKSLVQQLGIITQQQSSIAALLGGSMAKQTGAGLGGLLGAGIGGAGFGALLGAGSSALGFLDAMVAPGRAGVGGNVATRNRMLSEGLEAQTPTGRLLSDIRKFVDPLIDAVADTWEDVGGILSTGSTTSHTSSLGNHANGAGVRRGQATLARQAEEARRQHDMLRNNNGPVDHGSQKP